MLLIVLLSQNAHDAQGRICLEVYSDLIEIAREMGLLTDVNTGRGPFPEVRRPNFYECLCLSQILLFSS